MISNFYKKNKHILFYAYLFILISISFHSCSPNKDLSESQKIKNKFVKNKNKKERQSSNNFLAYHNNYYLSKVKFQDAIDLMAKEEESSNKFSSSMTIFDDAIKYSLIVINDFENSIFFEDASYIIARSSYYKNLLSPSSFYFKKILENNKSPYYFDSLVRLGFINIELKNIDDLESILNELDFNILNFNKNISYLKKKIPYKFLEYELLNTTSNYFILKAEWSKSNNNSPLSIESLYLKAIDAAITNNQKKDIYFKLIDFFQNLGDEGKILEYINQVKIQFGFDDDMDDLMSNWYKYNRKLGFFSDIHNYIDEKLSNDLNAEEKIYYSIEKAKTYLEQNDFIGAELIYEGLLLEYENKINSYKIYFSDIYNQLGGIYLVEYNDYEKALDYFSLSLEKNPSDIDVKNKFKSLEKYLAIFDQYLILNKPSGDDIKDSLYVDNQDSNSTFIIPLPQNYEYEAPNLDSLLFDMSSILYFELDLPDQALEKLNVILNNASTNNLISKVILLLKEINPEEDWDSIYADNIDLYSINKDSTLVNNINLDEAFLKMDKSVFEALDIFKNNFNKYNDLSSLYMIAFIYDEYINDIENAIKYYQDYISYESGDKHSKALSRVNEIKSNIKNELNIYRQELLYNEGLLELKNSFELSNNDSMLLKLEEYENGSQTKIDKDCNELLSIYQFPSHITLRDTLIKNDNYHIGGAKKSTISMANLITEVAEFLNRKVENPILAKEYYKLITDFYKDTNFFADASLSLNQIEPNSEWLSLFSEYNNKEFLDLERFNPRTGSEVIEATKSRLFPEDIFLKNYVYSAAFDSSNFNFIANEEDLISKYDLKLKNKFSSYNGGVSSKLAIVDDGQMEYFISDKKIFFNNNSVIAISPYYKNNIEVSIDGYFFKDDFLLVAFEIYNNIDDSSYRYNINNSQSECIYLGEKKSCYEIDFIPSNNANPKTAWILEIEDNIFIKIKEHEFDKSGSILYQKNIEYVKNDLYYIIEKIEVKDFRKKIITLLKRDNIKINNGKFSVDRIPNMKDKSYGLHNNFFYKSYSDIEIDFSDLVNRINDLDNLYKRIFSDENAIVDDNNFDYVQSINQYFYFVEDASIKGVELTNDDWLVSYNDDVVVGARKYTVGGNIDIPIMGYDNSSENTKIETEGYCLNGDLPIVKVHRKDGEIIKMNIITIEGDLEFKELGHATVILTKD